MAQPCNMSIRNMILIEFLSSVFTPSRSLLTQNETKTRFNEDTLVLEKILFLIDDY